MALNSLAGPWRAYRGEPFVNLVRRTSMTAVHVTAWCLPGIACGYGIGSQIVLNAQLVPDNLLHVCLQSTGTHRELASQAEQSNISGVDMEYGDIKPILEGWTTGEQIVT